MKKRVLYSIMVLALVFGMALPMATPIMADAGIGGSHITVQTAEEPHPVDVYIIGQTVRYSLRVDNLSSAEDMTVRIRDRIPMDPASLAEIPGVTTTYWWHATDVWLPTESDPVTIPPNASWHGTFEYEIKRDGVLIHPLVDYNVWMNQLVASGTQGPNENIVNYVQAKTVRVIEPAIELEKTVHPAQAEVGDTVTYTFTITNTGDWPLENITLEDDKLGGLTDDLAAHLPVDGVLAPGASSTPLDITYTIQAGDLPLVNEATVTGTAEDFAPAIQVAVVSHSDDAEVILEADESIHLEKAVWDGEDWLPADTPETGPELTSDHDPVVFRFVITNDGNVPLTSVTLSDTHISDFYTDEGLTTLATFPIALSPLESETVYGRLPWSLGEHSNTATATGTPPDEAVISASNDCHYVGVGPSISLQKDVWDGATWQDADTPIGPELTSLQDPVVFRFVITNDGNIELTGVELEDSEIGVFYTNFEGTTQASFPVSLAENQSRTFFGELPWAQGQHSNNATATGTPDGLPVVDAEDWCHYFGLGPAIDIQKRTNGVDADGPPGPSITIGATVTWTYIVTNTGGVPLTDIVVTDDQEGLIGNIALLAVGESQTLTATGTAEEGQYANIGYVVGDHNGDQVSDEDPSHYFGRTVPKIVVGWEAYPINGAAVLAPWIALFAALIVGTILLVMRRRRATH